MTTIELIEKHGICHNCLSDAYELGRKDERRKIMEIVDNADDIAQAMYLLGQYIISEELKNDNRDKK